MAARRSASSSARLSLLTGILRVIGSVMLTIESWGACKPQAHHSQGLSEYKGTEVKSCRLLSTCMHQDTLISTDRFHLVVADGAYFKRGEVREDRGRAVQARSCIRTRHEIMQRPDHQHRATELALEDSHRRERQLKGGPRIWLKADEVGLLRLCLGHKHPKHCDTKETPGARRVSVFYASLHNDG